MKKIYKSLLSLLLTLMIASPVLVTASARPEADQITDVQSLDFKEDELEKESIPLEQFQVTDNAEMSINDDAIILDINNENGALKIEDLDLDTETRYAIHYTYQKLDGKLNSFGGHTDGLFLNNLVAVDGKVTTQYTESDSAFVKNDKEEHEVIIEFVTPRDKASADFFIQPNRGDFDYVTLKISNIYLVELPEEE